MMNIGEMSRKIFWFVLFLEEVWLWEPGEVNTLIEIIMRILFNTNGGAEFVSAATKVNPAVILFLFLISIKPFVALVKTFLKQYTNTSLVLWINRMVFFRILLAAGLGLYIILKAMEFMNSPNVTLADLYQNRPFWLMVMGGWGLYAFVSPTQIQEG